jgi:hypothetical protein
VGRGGLRLGSEIEEIGEGGGGVDGEGEGADGGVRGEGELELGDAGEVGEGGEGGGGNGLSVEIELEG